MPSPGVLQSAGSATPGFRPARPRANKCGEARLPVNVDGMISVNPHGDPYDEYTRRNHFELKALQFHFSAVAAVAADSALAPPRQAHKRQFCELAPVCA